MVAALTAGLVAKVAIAGVAFGVVGLTFTELAHRIQALVGRVGWPPLRQVIGGIGIVGLFVLFGSDYLGLSLPLVDGALQGDRLGFAVFALKLVFTAVTLGCGLPGGEVTPLLVIGATLGVALAAPISPSRGAVGRGGLRGGVRRRLEHPAGVHDHGRRDLRRRRSGALRRRVRGGPRRSGHRSIYGTQRIAAGKGRIEVAGLPRVRDYCR